MIKLYDRITWNNNTTPALNETNLNAMSKALDDIDDRVIDIADLLVVVVPQVQEMIEQAQEIIDDAEQLVEDCEAQAQTSEAWAVGERGGVPVGSGDPTYHNNAKWYSSHLQTNIGNLNDVQITNPTDGDALVYNPTTQKWVNGAADVGLFIQNGILMCRYSA